MVTPEASAPVVMFPIEGGRVAHCIYAHDDLTPEQEARSQMSSPQPSGPRLPYWEYRGQGSIYAVAFCGNCDLGKSLHFDPSRSGIVACEMFVERGPAEYDLFNCGCRGY